MRESSDEFKVRVLEAFGNVPVDIIDKTISMYEQKDYIYCLLQ